MNISATKQNIFIKVEQNLSQLYIFNIYSILQSKEMFLLKTFNLKFFETSMLWII